MGNKGQALTETIIHLMILISLAFGGTVLMFQCFARIMLTRWAGENSRCIAQTDNSWLCAWKTKRQLGKFFSLKNVSVSEKILHGIIHTHLEARLLGSKNIKANYDLFPNEYKRTSR